MKKCKKTCNSCKYIRRCGSCSMCEVLLCKSNCNSCTTVCFNKPKIHNYLDSFENMDMVVKENYYKKLPMHIPIIPCSLSNVNKDFNIEYVAIHAGKLLYKNGEKIYRNYIEKGIHKMLNIKNTSKLILEFYVKDRFIEGFWDNRFEIYKHLKVLNFDYIIAPNYSLYEDLPRLEHLINIKRSSIVYNELLDIGINSIPDISWFNLTDLDNWIEEINNNNIRLIAFSFQNVGAGIKAANHWKHNLLGLRYLCSNIKNHVDIIIAGVVSPFRIAEIYNSIEKSNRLIILNQSAYVQSRKGILSGTRTNCPGLTFDEIFFKNVDYFNKIYKEIYMSDLIYNISKLTKDQLTNYYKTIGSSFESDELNHINNFLFRCMKKKRVTEVILCQNQEETH